MEAYTESKNKAHSKKVVQVSLAQYASVATNLKLLIMPKIPDPQLDSPQTKSKSQTEHSAL